MIENSTRNPSLKSFSGFAYLSEVFQSCHPFIDRWRNADRSGLPFARCRKADVPALVTHTVPRFQNLQALSLWRCSSLPDTAVAAFAASCHQLRILDLSLGTQLTDNALRGLAAGCPKLESLDLSGCTRVSEEGLVALFSCCKELRAVNLCGCVHGVTDKVLRVRSFLQEVVQTVPVRSVSARPSLG